MVTFYTAKGGYVLDAEDVKIVEKIKKSIEEETPDLSDVECLVKAYGITDDDDLAEKIADYIVFGRY